MNVNEYHLRLIVDDKYDEADLVHLNSEEAIEFSHTSDHLTESHSECINKQYFLMMGTIIAIINMLIKYYYSESVIVHSEAAAAGVLSAAARAVEG